MADHESTVLLRAHLEETLGKIRALEAKGVKSGVRHAFLRAKAEAYARMLFKELNK
jgi:hypothetical protein